MFKQSILIICLLFSCSNLCNANEMRFKKYNIENGLVQEIIRGVIQDNQGFIWIATEEGLNRFDGFEFKQFRHDTNNPNSISSDVITDMVIDANGFIWVSTLGGGLNRLNPLEQTFQKVGADKLSSNLIKKLFVDSKQRLWIGTVENGLDMIDLSNHELKVTNFSNGKQGVSHPSVRAFTEDSLGRIWIGTDGGGVDIYTPSSESWANIRNTKTSTNGLSGNRIRSLLKDIDGNIWIGTALNGLNKYDFRTKQIIQYVSDDSNPKSLSSNRVLSLIQDEIGQLWIGTEEGLNIFHDEFFSRIKRDQSKPESLSNNGILDIYQDKGGLIWIGTYRGINIWNPATAAFNHNLPQIKDKLSNAMVLDFAENSFGDIFIATYGGGILKKQAGSYDYQLISADEGLPDNRVTSVFVDRDDGLWVGTRTNGLLYFSKKVNNWIQYVNDPNNSSSLPSNGVTDIQQSKDGSIWVTTYRGGLSKKVENSFINVGAESELSSGLSSTKAMQIHEDQDGLIWVATQKGLNRLNPGDMSVKQFRHDPNIPTSLSDDLSWQILEDREGNFWIATQGSGVNLWKYEDRINETEIFQNITREDGLLSNTIYGLAEDNEGNIWLSSTRGLSRFNPAQNEFKHFDLSHGLQGYDYNLAAVYQSRNGVIYFGGSNGFNYFNPSDLPKNLTTPAVQLTNVSGIDGIFNLINQNNLQLNYTDYFVAFDFVALDFAAPEKNQYQYKLEGFDTDWLSVGNLRRATYTNLPAGNFVFKVKASNNDGVWSDEQVNLPVKVLPAPWRTVWAYGIYALVICTMIILFLRTQMRKLAAEEKQRKELEREVKKRTQELALQNKQLIKLNEDLDRAHRVDALTGLNNRHFLDQYLEAAVPRVDGSHQSGETSKFLFVMLVDMDNLKPVNDSYGHAAGDEAICHLANNIQKQLPDDMHIIRWGGDEFLLVGETEDKKALVEWVKNLFEHLKSQSFQYFDYKITLSFSAGFAFYPFDVDDPTALTWDQVSMVADKALYSAKETKQNWCGVARPTRDINELYISDISNAKKLTDVAELVELY